MGDLGRDVNLAKQAFIANDSELSRVAHNKLSSQENHKSGGDYVKTFIFGGLDGIMTTFAVVAGVAGARMGNDVILILGCAKLIADAIAMGLGDYLSEKAEIEFVKSELGREEWEFDNNIDGEKKEMIEIYTGKGMSPQDATELIEIMSQYKKIFLDTMMVEELGLQTPDPDASPLKQGIVMFFAFIFFGAIPLIGYAFGSLIDDDDILFEISIGLTAFTLIVLGFIKGHLTSQGKIKTALEMLINGGLAAAASYGLGWGIQTLVTDY